MPLSQQKGLVNLLGAGVVGVKVIMIVAIFRTSSGATVVLGLHVLGPQQSSQPWASGFSLIPFSSAPQASWGPIHCEVQCSTPLCLELHQPDFAKD